MKTKEKLILYHGSTDIVKQPELALGKLKNDYGQGFYCTMELELAKEWAVRQLVDGYANKYELNTSNINILNLHDGNHNVLHWMALLLKNRDFGVSNDTAMQVKEFIIKNFLPDLTDADLVIGYRADDSYFDYAKAFLNNTLPVSKLEWALMNGNLGLQYVLISEKAFENISFIEAIETPVEFYYSMLVSRERKAKKDYIDLISSSAFDKNEIYAIDLTRNEMVDYVPRLSKI